MSTREIEQGMESVLASMKLPLLISTHASSQKLLLDIATLDARSFDLPDSDVNHVITAQLAFLLTRHWNRSNGYSHPKAEDIEAELGIGKTTRKKALNALRKLGWFGVIEGRKSVLNGETIFSANQCFPLWDRRSSELFTTRLREIEEKAKSKKTTAKIESKPVFNDTNIAPF